MSREMTAGKETLAMAAVVFCQKVYEAYPDASIEPVEQHYTDEDLTLEVHLGAGTDLRKASDDVLRLTLEVEDQFGVAILTRVTARETM